MGNLTSLLSGNCSNKLVEGNKDDLFNDFIKDNLIRLGYSYLIFALFAYVLVKFQTDPHKTHTHILLISGIFIISTFILELLWLYFFSEGLRSNKGKGYSARSTIHNILNNLLPITSLMF